MLSTYGISGYWFLFLITLCVLLHLFFETIAHRRRLKKIQYRIHVNGTRGKSSVTRLIAAGLRAGGITTCAKTTGTLARFIHPDGKEETIFRRGHTNIIEQVKIIKQAAKFHPEALVIECMAVHPLLQSLCELKLVQSTHGVLCNARPDHLDVMGPTENDVALALAATMSVKGKFYTPEVKHLPVFQMAADDRKSELIHIPPEEVNAVTDKEMQGFFYAEHKENVALALHVCAEMGIDRNTALEGMWHATPDPGAATIYTIEKNEHTVRFINGFAANDPDSTGELWHAQLKQHNDFPHAIALVNCREDRGQRSVQLAQAMNHWTLPEECIVFGSGVDVFIKSLDSTTASKMTITNAKDWSLEHMIDYLTLATRPKKQLAIGMCNIAHLGFDLVDYFRDHHKEHA